MRTIPAVLVLLFITTPALVRHGLPSPTPSADAPSLVTHSLCLARSPVTHSLCCGTVSRPCHTTRRSSAVARSPVRATQQGVQKNFVCPGTATGASSILVFQSIFSGARRSWELRACSQAISWPV